MPEPTAVELAPIFHTYGLAVYTGQLLEHGLGLLLSVIDEERKREGLPPRTTFADPRSHKTLGVLFGEVKLVEYLSESEQKQIQYAAKVRNQLVHSYWNERHMQATLTPRKRGINLIMFISIMVRQAHHE